MFKRVSVVLNFTRDDEADDFFNDCKLALPKSVTINPGLPNQEPGIITLDECTHGDIDHSHCTIIEQHKTTD